MTVQNLCVLCLCVCVCVFGRGHTFVVICYINSWCVQSLLRIHPKLQHVQQNLNKRPRHYTLVILTRNKTKNVFPLEFLQDMICSDIKLCQTLEILLGTLKSPPQSLPDYSIPGRVLVVAWRPPSPPVQRGVEVFVIWLQTQWEAQVLWCDMAASPQQHGSRGYDVE